MLLQDSTKFIRVQTDVLKDFLKYEDRSNRLCLKLDKGKLIEQQDQDQV